MNETQRHEKLLQFLDRHAFDPVLECSPDRFQGAKRERFEAVRRSTENEKKRFHEVYRTAMEVKNNYLSDLSSRTGHEKSAELEALGLPTLPQLREDFLKLCDELGMEE